MPVQMHGSGDAGPEECVVEVDTGGYRNSLVVGRAVDKRGRSSRGNVECGRVLLFPFFASCGGESVVLSALWIFRGETATDLALE